MDQVFALPELLWPFLTSNDCMAIASLAKRFTSFCNRTKSLTMLIPPGERTVGWKDLHLVLFNVFAHRFIDIEVLRIKVSNPLSFYTIPDRRLERILDDLLGDLKHHGYENPQQPLPFHHLRTLDLSQNLFNVVGARAITKMLLMIGRSSSSSSSSSMVKKQGFNGLEKLLLKGNDLQHRGFNLLSRGLKLMPCSHLKVLDLDENRIADEGAVILAEMFESQVFPCLTTLSLARNWIGPKGAFALGRAWCSTNNSRYLTSIELFFNPLFDGGILAILNALFHRHQPLTHLGLAGTQSKGGASQALANILLHQTSFKLESLDVRNDRFLSQSHLFRTIIEQGYLAPLKVLRIPGWDGSGRLHNQGTNNKCYNVQELELVGEWGMDAEMAFLTKCPSLSILKLTCCTSLKMSNGFFQAIGEGYLPWLTQLYFKRCQLGPDGVQAVAGALSQGKCPKLIQLHLIIDQIGFIGGLALNKLFRVVACPKLETLILERTGLTEIRVGNLCEAIANSRSHAFLSTLSLEHNKIGDKGMESICSVLLSSSRHRLRVLRLAGIGTTAVGVESLARTLRGQAKRGGASSLETLVLRENLIGDEGFRHIASLFEDGTLANLRELDLAGCGAGRLGLDFFCKSFAQRSHRNLQHLSLELNPHFDRIGIGHLAEVLAPKLNRCPKLEYLGLDREQYEEHERMREIFR